MIEEKLEKVSTKRIVLFTFFFIGYGVVLAISSIGLTMSGHGVILPLMLFQAIPFMLVELMGGANSGGLYEIAMFFFGGVLFWVILGVLTAISKRYKWLQSIVLLLLFFHYLMFFVGCIQLLLDNKIWLELGSFIAILIFGIFPFILFFFGQILIVIDIFWTSLKAKLKVIYSLAGSIIIFMLLVIVSFVYSITTR